MTLQTSVPQYCDPKEGCGSLRVIRARQEDQDRDISDIKGDVKEIFRTIRGVYWSVAVGGIALVIQMVFLLANNFLRGTHP